MTLIILVLMLFAIHLIFRNGCISGCATLLLTPVVFVLGVTLLIALFHWLK